MPDTVNPAPRRLDIINTLDPKADCHKIFTLFMKDFQTALTFQTAQMLMMPFAAPRMSRILDATGAFYADFKKRAVDQALLGAYMMSAGFGENMPGDAAVQRVNAMHSHYDIHPKDFVAIAAEIAVTPIHMAQTYGWRQVTDAEKAANVEVARRVVMKMGAKSFPETFEDLEGLLEDYLDTQLFIEPQNRKLADPLVEFYNDCVPQDFKAFQPTLTLSIVDARILTACEQPIPDVATITANRAFLMAASCRDPLGDDIASPLALIIHSQYPQGVPVNRLGTHLDTPPALTSAYRP